MNHLFFQRIPPVIQPDRLYFVCVFVKLIVIQYLVSSSGFTKSSIIKGLSPITWGLSLIYLGLSHILQGVYLLSLEYWGLTLTHLGLKISSVYTLIIVELSSVRTIQCPLLPGDCPFYIGDCPLYIRGIYYCPLSIGDCLLSLRDV